MIELVASPPWRVGPPTPRGLCPPPGRRGMTRLSRVVTVACEKWACGCLASLVPRARSPHACSFCNSLYDTVSWPRRLAGNTARAQASSQPGAHDGDGAEEEGASSHGTCLRRRLRLLRLHCVHHRHSRFLCTEHTCAEYRRRHAGFLRIFGSRDPLRVHGEEEQSIVMRHCNASSGRAIRSWKSDAYHERTRRSRVLCVGQVARCS